MDRRPGSHGNDRRGAAAVEFALVAPLLLLLSLGMVELGYHVRMKAELGNVARFSADIARTAQSVPDLQATLDELLSSGVMPDTADLSLNTVEALCTCAEIDPFQLLQTAQCDSACGGASRLWFFRIVFDLSYDLDLALSLVPHEMTRTVVIEAPEYGGGG